MLRVRALLSSNDDDGVDIGVECEHARGVLILFRGVADRIAALDGGGTPLDGFHNVLELLGVERGLVEDFQLRIRRPIDGIDLIDLRDDVVRSRIEIVCVPDYLAMSRIADEDEVVAVMERLSGLAMDVVDELAGGVEDL